MSMAWFKQGMPEGAIQRGGAPVGMLEELPPVEMGAVLLLRLWCEGGAGRARIQNDLTLAFGTARADRELERLAALVRTVLKGARRPVMRHGVACPCFGGDESAFANMVAAAAQGERDDAMVFALALMAPDFACAAAQLAGPVGLAILGLSRNLGAAPSPIQTMTRH